MSNNTEEEITKQTSQSHVDVDRNNMDDRGDGDTPPASYNCKDILQSTDTILEDQPSSSTPTTAVKIDGADELEYSFANDNNDKGNEDIKLQLKPQRRRLSRMKIMKEMMSLKILKMMILMCFRLYKILKREHILLSFLPLMTGAVWMFPIGTSPGEGDVIDAAVSGKSAFVFFII